MPQSGGGAREEVAARTGWRGLDPEHWRLLQLLGAASFFEGYDFNIITVALKPLRTSFGLSQSSAALWIGVVYLGALPAVVLARRADRQGRRGVLLWSMVGYTVATAATAASPDIGSFVAFQFAARFFLVTQSILAWTVIAEELPADKRGFGFGWLAMLSALGTGWSAILNGSLLSPLGASWRWLYVLALPVLLVVMRLRRSLPESHRYSDEAEHGRLIEHWTAIGRRPHRSRLLLLCGVAVLANLTMQATTYVVDYMETQRHLSSSAANLTLVASGALAIPILVASGSISDRVGRKPIICGALVLSVVGFVCFFEVAHSELALFLALALVYAGIFGAWPAASGYGAELFPTALRALGNSFGAGAKYLGQSASFVVAGALIGGTGHLGRAVLVLCGGPLVAAVLIMAFFPETGGRELESISPG